MLSLLKLGLPIKPLTIYSLVGKDPLNILHAVKIIVDQWKLSCLYKLFRCESANRHFLPKMCQNIAHVWHVCTTVIFYHFRQICSVSCTAAGRGGAAHLSSDKLSRYFIRICPNFTLVWSGAASLAQLFEQSYNIWTFGHIGGGLISETEGGNLASVERLEIFCWSVLFFLSRVKNANSFWFIGVKILIARIFKLSRVYWNIKK